MNASSPILPALMKNLRGRIESTTPLVRMGEVVQVTGLVIESIGPNVSLGDICEIRSPRLSGLQAEVVGFRDHRVLLMPLGEMQEIHAGCEVAATGRAAGINVSDALIGRIIDGIGRPIDGKGPLPSGTLRPLHCQPPNPLTRQRILQPFQTGVKSLDLFTPVGRGQRLGIFAGSGVGKSTLLGMIARGAESDINVIALIGERNREVRGFIEHELGKEGLAQQQSFCRAVIAKHLGRQDTGCKFGAQAQINKRHGEGGVVTGIDQIAMEQQGGADAHGRTSNCCNDGFLESAERAHEMKHGRLCGGRWLVQKITDVIACTENTFMTLYDQHTACAVGLCIVNGFGHGRIHVARDGILFV
jgi:hypothetical protein